MPLGTEVGLGPGHIVPDGDPAPPPKKKGAEPLPTFQPVYCGQRVGWFKMPFSTKVGLSPGNTVFDADPAPPPKGQSPPIFDPCLLWPNSWVDQDANWYEGRPRPKQHCVTWGSSFPHKGHSPPIFGPLSTVAKQSPISVNC